MTIFTCLVCDEVLTGHVGWLLESHDVEDCWSNVGETTVLDGSGVVVRHVDARYWVEGVCGVWCAVWVDGVVGIAVVGDDDSLVTGGLGSLDDLAYAVVYGYYGLGDGVVHTGVAYHVAVGEVNDDEVVLVLLDGVNQLVLHLVGGHLWLEVVGGYLWRSHEDAVLTFVWSLATTVEEECNVCILLRLSGVELLLALL